MTAWCHMHNVTSACARWGPNYWSVNWSIQQPAAALSQLISSVRSELVMARSRMNQFERTTL